MILLLIFDLVEHICNSGVITFCVGKLLHLAIHFALITLLHFSLVLHFAAIVITFSVSITFCGDYYILRRNIRPINSAG